MRKLFSTGIGLILALSWAGSPGWAQTSPKAGGSASPPAEERPRKTPSAPLIPLVPPTPPVAQRAPAPRGVPPQVLVPGEGVNIRADTLTEDAERRLVIGEGFVDLQFLDNRLQADRVEINVDTGEGVAQGNVVFRDKENRLVCDRIEFNTRRQQALLYGVRGEIGRLYKITGARVERQSPVKYRILDGSLSTCKAPIPEWQFRSRSIDVTLEGFAIARQPTFWVAGFPVAFLPYMVAPVKTKRATGFLVPRIGQSNRDGFKYDQAFFWAFSENADATFGLEYRVKRGFIPKVEGRYRLSRTTWGRADFKYLDDDLTGKTFYRFRAEHRQEFWNQFTGFYRAERVNDLDFDSEFEEEVGVRTRRDVESLVNVQRNWDRASLRFNAQFLDSAEESRKEFFQRFPDASFNLSPTVGKVGPIVISPSVNTSIVRFNQRQEQQEDEVWRLDAAPRLSLPITGLTWFTFTPFAEGRITYYSDGRKAADRSRKSGAFTREILATGVTSEGPRFFRTFPVGFKRFPAFKHLTQTKFSYIFRPDIDEGDRQKIVKIDSIDAFERQHRLTYSWENRILAKIRTGRQSFETREVLSLTVSNFLDINRLSEDKDRPLGDVTFRLESKPFRLWRIGFDADYNIYDEEVSSYGISLDLRQGRDWFLRHETRFKDRKGGEADELNNNFSAGLRILKVFYLEGGARWTEEKAKLLEKNIRFRFQDCCWGITLEFLERDDETLFQIGFNLVGLIGDEDAPFFKFGRARKTTTE